MKLDKDNLRFKQAKDLLENTCKSFFLFGEAGTGKSTFIKHILKTSSKNIILTAPTGLAALNVKGVTIHSFFEFPFRTLIPNDKGIKCFPEDSRKKKIIQNMDTLIIDEISMVRADIIDAIDYSLRINTRSRNLPFGGIQVVFVGDLYQLEPIVKREHEYESMLDEVYGGNLFFFNSIAVKEMSFTPLKLNKIYRQNNDNFIDLLQRIRSNKITDDDIFNLNQNLYIESEINKDAPTITLTTTRAAAKKINEFNLNKLVGKKYFFDAQIDGDFSENNYPCPARMVLKIGAQVMFVKNDSEKRWVNGSIGTVSSLSSSEITVKLKDGTEHFLNQVKWDNIKYNYNKEKKSITPSIVGSFTAFPIKLSWAITIHKSQGLNLDSVLIDFSNGTFASGQAYVALSRVKSLSNVKFKSQVSKEDFYFSENIIEFDKTIKHCNSLIEYHLAEGKQTYSLCKNKSWERLGKLYMKKAAYFLTKESYNIAMMYFNKAYKHITCDCWASDYFVQNKKIDEFLVKNINHSNPPLVNLLKAIVYMHKKDCESAYPYIKNVYEIYPNYELVNYLMGRILKNMDSVDFENALHYFIKAHKIKKTSKTYYIIGRGPLNDSTLLSRFLAVYYNPSSGCAHWHFSGHAMNEGVFPEKLKHYEGAYDKHNHYCGLKLGLKIEDKVSDKGLQSIQDYLYTIEKIMNQHNATKAAEKKGTLNITDDPIEDTKSYEEFNGVYGLDDDTINDAFDGDPSNYWNID